MGRTALFSRKQPGGVWTIDDLNEHPGDIYFVDSGSSTGSDAVGYGKSPDKPFATLDYAVGQCTASQGDTIYVMPGHAETVSAAAGLDFDVAGITVIGLGAGELRPTVTVGTAVDADVDIGAANITIRNLLFKVDKDSLNALLDVDADDATIENCEFREGSSKQADVFVMLASANVADRCTIRDCKFFQTAAGGAAAIKIDDAQDQLLIEDNWIDGDWSSAGIYSDAVFTDSIIRRNVVANRNSGNHAIELSAAATGFLVDNRLYGDTLGTILDPGSLKCLGNLETDAVDEAGVDTPRTSAGGLAAGSITAAAIDDDAITAAKFASDAIAAAAIANGAIDAGAIASDAITAAKVADDTLSFEHFADDAPVVRTVKKESQALTGGSVTDVFTIAGGPVQLVGLIMHITTAVSADACNAKWELDPTTGSSASDLCANLDIASAAIGDMLYITGVHDAAMVKAANGTEAGQMCATQVMLTPGGIDLTLQNSDPSTGVADVYLVYRALGNGVTVTTS